MSILIFVISFDYCCCYHYYCCCHHYYYYYYYYYYHDYAYPRRMLGAPRPPNGKTKTAHRKRPA